MTFTSVVMARGVNMYDEIRVWIDDRNAIFRRGLASCLSIDGFRVQGESAMLQPEPDLKDAAVMLFDPEPPQLQRAVQLAQNTEARLVAIASEPQEELLFDCLEAGLAGFLIRRELSPEVLTNSLRAVVAGNGSIPPLLLRRLIDALAKGERRGGRAGGLARRELDVLRLVADGGETREIAVTLSYSERTVKNIVHDVLTKMNCRTRAHAVALATRQGFI
jgi:DNA-binding NarL/FixJ family response regulator